MVIDIGTIQRCRVCGSLHIIREIEVGLEEFYCEICGFKNEVISHE